MGLDLFAIGPPSHGLFTLGKRHLDVKGDGGGPLPADDGKTATDIPRSGKTSLSPYIEALQTEMRLARARRVLSPYLPAESRKTLGSNVDVRG